MPRVYLAFFALVFFICFFNLNQLVHGLSFNFGAVGDFGCNSSTDATVDNILDKNPELVLGLGDYSYQATADCWLARIQPIDSITRINIGNHEDQESEGFEQYMNHFGLSQTYYSYNYQNVHILTMMFEPTFIASHPQFNFVVNDLEVASQDPNIDWIIVNVHDWVYRSSSTNPLNDDFAEIYHPIFDQFGVDLVLSGHEHNYHRTYPLKFNPNNHLNPLVTSTNPNDYLDPSGQVYAVVGTGGVNLIPIVGASPFVRSSHDDFFGQLDIRFTDNGGKLEGRLFRNGDNAIMDTFSITKMASGAGTYHYAPGLVLTGSNFQDAISPALSQFSAAAWFKTSTNFASEAFILNKGGIGSDRSGQNQNYQISMTSSERIKAGFETSTGADHFVTSPGTYNDGQWHYAVVTNNGTNLVLYIDGAQVASAATSGSPEQNTKPFRVGANSRVTPPTTNFFTGEVDEVRVWNDDLTAQEVFMATAGTSFNTGELVLHLPFGNSVPIAHDQATALFRNTIKSITIKATDPDSDILNYAVIAQPEHGTLSGTAPNLTYNPLTDFVGSDSFTFKANDGTTDSNIATVNITVNQQRPPVASNQNIDVEKNTPELITITAEDPDNSTLNYAIVAQPEHGTLSGTAPNLTYNPLTDFVGSDSFTFKANDGTTDSNIATVSITVEEPGLIGEYQYAPGFTLTGSNYHDVPNSPSLQLSQFSVATWFKTSTNFFGTEVFILNKGGIGSDSAGQNQNYQISMTSTERIKAGFETSTGADHFVTSPNAYSDGQWHYAVVTNNGTNLVLYIDGVQVATKSTIGASPETSGTKPLRIGANSRVNPPGNFFTGEVDEVRVWNDDLTAQQVSEAFVGTSFNTAEQVLHLPFGGAEGGYQYPPALVLTGSNYNDTPSSASLQLDQFSVATWFKTSTNFASEAFIVNKGGIGSDSVGQNQNYQISITGAEFIKVGFETSTGADQFVTSVNTYNDGQWHYAVVTNDGSNLRLYIDGVQVANKSTAGSSPETSGAKPVRVGANSRITPPGNFYTGEVDEVRVWNDDLTAQEVSNAFAGNDFNLPDQVLYLDFSSASLTGTYNYDPSLSLSGPS